MQAPRRIAGRVAQAIHRLPYFPGQWRLARLITALGGKPIFLQDNFGISYNVNYGNISHLLLTTGAAEPELVQLMPADCNIAIDIGSNVGTFALPAARRAKQVIAIDANEDMCRLLSENCKFNNIENVKIIHSAISNNQEASIEFFNADHEPSISSIHANHVKQFDSYRSISVPNARLCDIICTLEGNSIDFLKIDAEGASGQIIRSAGSFLSRIKVIVMEPSDDFDQELHDQMSKIFDVSFPLSDRDDLPSYTRNTIVAIRKSND